MKVIKENCDPKDAQDKSLPYTAYLVEYKLDTKTRYDLVMCGKAVDMFDHYYDNYRKDFVGWNDNIEVDHYIEVKSFGCHFKITQLDDWIKAYKIKND